MDPKPLSVTYNIVSEMTAWPLITIVRGSCMYEGKTVRCDDMCLIHFIPLSTYLGKGSDSNRLHLGIPTLCV